MDSRRCRNHTDNYGTVPQIYNCNCQREEKQHPPGQLIHYGMYRCKLFLSDVPNSDIEQFYHCYDGYP